MSKQLVQETLDEYTTPSPAYIAWAYNPQLTEHLTQFLNCKTFYEHTTVSLKYTFLWIQLSISLYISLLYVGRCLVTERERHKNFWSAKDLPSDECTAKDLPSDECTAKDLPSDECTAKDLPSLCADSALKLSILHLT